MTVSFTQRDLRNAEKFAEYNYRVRLLQLMYKRRPYLVSHLRLTDRPAVDADFYIPPGMEDRCRVLDVSIGRRLCEKLSCNRSTEREPCAPDSSASYYWLGDDAYDVQCQPACFNVRDAPTYRPDGSRDVDTPQLNYHKGSCRIVPDAVTTYLEKPFFRSSVRYERRVNDIRAGFSRVPNDRDYGCGFDYRNNAWYCSEYDRTLTDDGDCSYTWLERGVDAVVGMSFVNTVKSAVRQQIDVVEGPRPLPDGLPPKPTAPKPEHTLRGWRADVNADFRVPELIDIAAGDGVNAARRERAGTSRSRRSIGTGNGLSVPEAREKLQHLMESVTKMLQSSEFWTSLGASWAFDRSLDEIKRFSYRAMENVQRLLAHDLYRIVEMGFCRAVLTGSLQSTARSVIAHTALRTAGKFAVALAKMTAAATSVVGWLLIITNVLDVVFALWDPYGYDNMFPKRLPNDLMLAGETALRLQFGSATVEYGFENLVRALVTENEILQIQLTGMLEKAVYLDSLEVNGEGGVIDKHDLLTVPVRSDFDAVYADESGRALAKRARFDRALYDRYNRDFLRRAHAARTLGSAAVCLTATIVSVACLRLYVLAFFFVFLLLACLTLHRFVAVHGGDGVVKLSKRVGL